jgi:hypothetical protein
MLKINKTADSMMQTGDSEKKGIGDWKPGIGKFAFNSLFDIPCSIFNILFFPTPVTQPLARIRQTQYHINRIGTNH